MTDQTPPAAGGMPPDPEQRLTAAADAAATSDSAAAAQDAAATIPAQASDVAAGVAAADAWQAAPAPQPPAPPTPTGWVQPPQQPAGPPPGEWSSYTAGPQRGPAAGWEYGGFWIRAVAYIVDGFILGLVTTVLWALVLGVVAAIGIGAVASSIHTDTGLTEQQGVVLGVGIVVAFIFLGIMTLLVTSLYFVLLWVKRGATIGQSIMGLRVVRRADGGPIGWGAAIIRYVVLYIGFMVFYLGVIWVAFDDRKRGWHDLAASTLVVKRG